MTHNMGIWDRIFRVAIAIALLSLYFVLEGNFRYFAVIGLVPLMTAAMGWCPFYTLFGIKTCRCDL